jgi:hypothetical protein
MGGWRGGGGSPEVAHAARAVPYNTMQQGRGGADVPRKAQIKPKKVKIPAQLFSLIGKEGNGLEDDGYLQPIIMSAAEEAASAEAGCEVSSDSPGAAAYGNSSLVGNVQAPVLLQGQKQSRARQTAGSAHTVNEVVAASQLRFTKELSSYTRAVCMRLGYA